MRFRRICSIVVVALAIAVAVVVVIVVYTPIICLYSVLCTLYSGTFLLVRLNRCD